MKALAKINLNLSRKDTFQNIAFAHYVEYFQIKSNKENNSNEIRIIKYCYFHLGEWYFVLSAFIKSKSIKVIMMNCATSYYEMRKKRKNFRSRTNKKFDKY